MGFGLVLVLSLSLISAGFFSDTWNKLTNPTGDVTLNPTIPGSCHYDSDRGDYPFGAPFNVYESGYILRNISGVLDRNAKDYCLDNNRLREYYCESWKGYSKYKNVDCSATIVQDVPGYCADNACHLFSEQKTIGDWEQMTGLNYMGDTQVGDPLLKQGIYDASISHWYYDYCSGEILTEYKYDSNNYGYKRNVNCKLYNDENGGVEGADYCAEGVCVIVSADPITPSSSVLELTDGQIFWLTNLTTDALNKTISVGAMGYELSVYKIDVLGGGNGNVNLTIDGVDIGSKSKGDKIIISGGDIEIMRIYEQIKDSKLFSAVQLNFTKSVVLGEEGSVGSCGGIRTGNCFSISLDKCESVSGCVIDNGLDLCAGATSITCSEVLDEGVCESLGCNYIGAVLVCDDTNAGELYFNGGFVIQGESGNEVTYKDHCTEDGNSIIEYSCGENNQLVEREPFLCPSEVGCNSDSDGIGSCGLPAGKEGVFCEPISTGKPNIAPGTRVNIDGVKKYCNPQTLEYESLKAVGVGCVADYQCVSNLCLDGKCTSLREELGFLKKIWCAISNPVDFTNRPTDTSGNKVDSCTLDSNDYCVCVSD